MLILRAEEIIPNGDKEEGLPFTLVIISEGVLLIEANWMLPSNIIPGSHKFLKGLPGLFKAH